MTIYKRVPDLRAPEASVAMSQNYKRLLLLYSATNLTGDLRQEQLFPDVPLLAQDFLGCSKIICKIICKCFQL